MTASPIPRTVSTTWSNAHKRSTLISPTCATRPNALPQAYGARYTPEAFVLNSKSRLRYIGRIDDNWQHPAKVKSRDLHSAIEAILAHKKVENPVTHAIGSTHQVEVVNPMVRNLILLFVKLAINALALVVVDAMFRGIWVEPQAALRTTIAAAVLLALVNTYLRPLVLVLTLRSTS